MPALRSTPRLSAPPWGGTTLAARWGKGSDPGARLGESWEVWRDNAVDGGGTLADHVDLPLLVKLLDTREVLSVQVHPDDATARRVLGVPTGKAEGWVVLAAEPGARIAYGLEREMDADTLRARALSGEIEADLRWIPVAPGDVIDVPPGTIHAIGAGLTLYEVQQPADLTWRLYDWGRGRELHLDHALLVAGRVPVRPTARPVPVGPGRVRLLDTPAFRVDRVEVPAVAALTEVAALTVIEGVVEVDGMRVAAGSSVVAWDATLGGAGVALVATAR